jgi:uncharacterized protein
MEALSRLRPVDLASVMRVYLDLLRTHQDAINRLNVYPVPDGDTGTNMALTVESVVTELDEVTAADAEGPTLAEVCKAMAHGSLMGARGNSGVILSQLLRGISGVLSPVDGSSNGAARGTTSASRHGTIGPVAGGAGNAEAQNDEAQNDEAQNDEAQNDEAGGTDGSQLADALVAASDAAHKAVLRPAEGTILTVAREAGQGAKDAALAGEPLVTVAEHARDRAAAALARTPEQLPVLARAGVVDAGGAGYLLMFDALLNVTEGRPLPEPDPTAPDAAGSVLAYETRPAPGELAHPLRRGEPSPAASGADATEPGEGTGAGLRYEVMYMLEAPDDTIPAFKEGWAGIGDSIVVVGGDGLWNCHIHTDDVGSAIEAALDVGRPRNIRVTDLSEQVEEERWVREGGKAPVVDQPGHVPRTAVVAVATGEGIARIFRSLGVHHVVPGGQTMNPSTEQILKVVDSIPSPEVVLLPNNENIQPVAMQVAALADRPVTVVPTSSIVEGFAALLEYDPESDASANKTAMAASACRVVPGEVTRAVRDSPGPNGPIHEGDWLGLSRHQIEATGSSLDEVSRALLDKLIEPHHELVTLIEGEGPRHGETRRLTEWLSEKHPQVAVEVHHGGQPLYPYLFSIE